MLEHDSSGVQGPGVTGKSEPNEPIKLTLGPGESAFVVMQADGTVLAKKIDAMEVVQVPIHPIGWWESRWFLVKARWNALLWNRSAAKRFDLAFEDPELYAELTALKLLIEHWFRGSIPPDKDGPSFNVRAVAAARRLIEDYHGLQIAQVQRAQVYQSFLQMKNEQDRIAVYLRDRYPGAIARGEHDNKSLADLVIHYLSKS